LGANPGLGCALGHGLSGVGRRDDLFDQALGAATADTVDQHQDTHPRDRVDRIGNHAQMREDIFDVRGLDELEAAALDEGDVAAL
jgi:hypothetical protein